MKKIVIFIIALFIGAVLFIVKTGNSREALMYDVDGEDVKMILTDIKKYHIVFNNMGFLVEDRKGKVLSIGTLISRNESYDEYDRVRDYPSFTKGEHYFYYEEDGNYIYVANFVNSSVYYRLVNKFDKELADDIFSSLIARAVPEPEYDYYED